MPKFALMSIQTTVKKYWNIPQLKINAFVQEMHKKMYKKNLNLT